MNAPSMLLVATLAQASATGGPGIAGSPWDSSLAPGTVSTYLDGDAPAVLVVATGPDADTQGATRALEASLRKTARVRLVMSGTSLGDVSTLGDEDIAKKAKGLPVDTVAVVRTFAGAEAPTLVVTFYGPDGNLHSALTVVRGKALVAREGGAGRGVSTAALTAVRDDARKQSASPAEPPPGPVRLKWLEGSRGFLERRTSDERGVHVSSSFVEGSDFYETLNRRDLAVAYRSRQAARATGYTLAGIAIPVGLLVAPLGLLLAGCLQYSGTPADRGTCVTRDYSLFAWGTGILGVGIAGAIVGAATPSDPISPREQSAMVKAFNEKSAAAAPPEAPPSPPSPPVSLHLSVAPAPQGAAVMLWGTF